MTRIKRYIPWVLVMLAAIALAMAAGCDCDPYESEDEDPCDLCDENGDDDEGGDDDDATDDDATDDDDDDSVETQRFLTVVGNDLDFGAGFVATWDGTEWTVDYPDITVTKGSLADDDDDDDVADDDDDDDDVADDDDDDVAPETYIVLSDYTANSNGDQFAVGYLEADMGGVIIESMAAKGVSWTGYTPVGTMGFTSVTSTALGTFATTPVIGESLYGRTDTKDSPWDVVTGDFQTGAIFNAIAANDDAAYAVGFAGSDPVVAMNDGGKGWDLVDLSTVNFGSVTDIQFNDVAFFGDKVWIVGTGTDNAESVGVALFNDGTKGWSLLDLGVTDAFAFNAAAGDLLSSLEYTYFGGWIDDGTKSLVIYEVLNGADPVLADISYSTDNDWELVDVAAVGAFGYALGREIIAKDVKTVVLERSLTSWDTVSTSSLSGFPQNALSIGIHFRELEE